MHSDLIHLIYFWHKLKFKLRSEVWIRERLLSWLSSTKRWDPNFALVSKSNTCVPWFSCQFGLWHLLSSKFFCIFFFFIKYTRDAVYSQLIHLWTCSSKQHASCSCLPGQIIWHTWLMHLKCLLEWIEEELTATDVRAAIAEPIKEKSITNRHPNYEKQKQNIPTPNSPTYWHLVRTPLHHF